MSSIGRLGAFLGPVLLASTVACTSTTNTTDGVVASDGQQFVCDESCSTTCRSANGAGCNFVCQGGTCSFDCPGGNCAVACNGSANCNVSCPKGGCNVAGNDGRVDVSCGGKGTCTVACSGPAESCLVDGTPAAGSEESR